MTFREFLAGALAERQIRQAELAKKIGVSRGAVSRWLSGDSVPDFDSCIRLVTFLSLPPGQVLEILSNCNITLTDAIALHYALAGVRGLAAEGQSPQSVTKKGETGSDLEQAEVMLSRLLAQIRWRKNWDLIDGHFFYETAPKSLAIRYISSHVDNFLGYQIADWRKPRFLIETVHAEDLGILKKSRSTPHSNCIIRLRRPDNSYQQVREISQTRGKGRYGFLISNDAVCESRATQSPGGGET